MQSSAKLYALIKTAKANGLEPTTYLRRVFRLLPAAMTVADIEALLPWAESATARPPRPDKQADASALIR